MIDYAKVAETLHAMIGDVDELYHHAVAPRNKQALAAATELCEAHAVDETDYVDILFDGPPSHKSGRFVEVENSKRQSIKIGEWIHRDDGYWVLRFARSDARAKVADWQPIESAPDDCTMVLVPIDESSTMAFYVKSDGVWKDCDGEVMEPQPNYFMYLPEAPAPPTVEGEQK